MLAIDALGFRRSQAAMDAILDANGEAHYSFPGGSLSGVAGVTIYANVRSFDPVTGLPSDATEVTAHTLQ